MFWQRRADRAARVGTRIWIDSEKGGGLLDLRMDLGERHDLSASKPEVLDQVKSCFDAWRAKMQNHAGRFAITESSSHGQCDGGRVMDQEQS